jgi:copper chaperone CopZ
MASKAILEIEGMHCDACVRRVRAALSGVEGVRVNDVQVGRADIEIAPGNGDVEDAVSAVNDIGFSATVKES